MQDSIFYTVRPKKGDIMWVLPIRWWEEDEPHRIEIIEDCKDNSKYVYCMSEHYGHTVYINRTFVAHKKETSIEIIKHLRAMRELMSDDGMDVLMDRIFENE